MRFSGIMGYYSFNNSWICAESQTDKLLEPDNDFPEFHHQIKLNTILMKADGRMTVCFFCVSGRKQTRSEPVPITKIKNERMISLMYRMIRAPPSASKTQDKQNS